MEGGVERIPWRTITINTGANLIMRRGDAHCYRAHQLIIGRSIKIQRLVFFRLFINLSVKTGGFLRAHEVHQICSLGSWALVTVRKWATTKEAGWRFIELFLFLSADFLLVKS